MKFTMPMAVFGGLVLIATAIYFGPGSREATADFPQEVVICGHAGNCVDVSPSGALKVDDKLSGEGF